MAQFLSPLQIANDCEFLNGTGTITVTHPYNIQSPPQSYVSGGCLLSYPPGDTVKITATQVAVVRGNGAVEVFDSVAEAERKAALWAANDRDECLILKPVKRIASKPVDVETTDLP